MGTPRQYSSAHACRAALEAGLIERSRRDDTDLQRLRRQVAFDRLLARMFGQAHQRNDGWILKGGYALEMRPAFFVFEVGAVTLMLDQAPEGGARFPVDARLDGRSFVTFHVDLGVGDEVLEPLDEIMGEDWLGFAGIAPLAVPALSAEQHWAEKLHAYTRPRNKRINTRVKDLIDLVLLIQQETLAAERVVASVDATFARRRTHEVPRELPAPPTGWQRPFAALAEECQLAHTPATAHAEVNRFWRGLER